MSELRDRVAERLAEIMSGQIVHVAESPEGFPSMTYVDLEPVADEVLRIVAWNRARANTKPTTLPPPDWKP